MPSGLDLSPLTTVNRLRGIQRVQDKYAPVDTDGPLIDWAPLKGPQAEAYFSEADELLYGGAAGGGKTDLITGLAALAHTKSIIFRREFTQFAEIRDRMDELYGPVGSYNSNDKKWKLRDGSMVELGYVQHASDWKKYKGRPHDFVAFDELTEWPRDLYRILIAWNRTAKLGQRCRVVSTTNPPTDPEQMWVVDEWAPWLDPKFPDPAEEGELRWYVYDGDDVRWVDGPEPVTLTDKDGKEETLTPKSRTFIRAMLGNNPYLERTGYGKVLDALPQELREAFKHGKFGLAMKSAPMQVIPTAWIMAAQERWKTLQLGLDKDEGESASGYTPNIPLTSLGVDPSRGGADQTVLAPRWGDYVGPLVVYEGSDSPDGDAVAGHVFKILEATGAPARCPVIVDVIGIGASVYDSCKQHFRTVAFSSSFKSTKKDRSGKFGFLNKRAEAYWRLRELLDPNKGNDGEPSTLALPDDPVLLADLAAPTYKLSRGGIQIEEKKDIAKRLGRSPDRGDAVVMAFEEGQSLSMGFADIL